MSQVVKNKKGNRGFSRGDLRWLHAPLTWHRLDRQITTQR